jgi:ubiquinone/menaquinone biosynthesis C-methylase UbiE
MRDTINRLFLKKYIDIFKKKNIYPPVTYERVIEGRTPLRIWDDHIERYNFSTQFVVDKIALDIACGSGYGSKIICNAGAKEVIGIDISHESIHFALNHYSDIKLKFLVGNINEIKFSDNYFDSIICFETIEHLAFQEPALGELKRVLKPDGILIISSPNRKVTSPGKSINEPPDNCYHAKEFSTTEFIDFLKLHFTVLEVYGQRKLNKLLFIPILNNKFFRTFFAFLYNPERGKSTLEKISVFFEYRYITVVCKKTK